MTFYKSQNFTDGIYVILQDSADVSQITQMIYEQGNIGTIFNSEELAIAMRDFIRNYLIIFEVMIFYIILVCFSIVLYNSVMNSSYRNYTKRVLIRLLYNWYLTRQNITLNGKPSLWEIGNSQREN